MIALCVDDEPIILEMERRLIAASPGISEVVPFTSGEKAIKWLRENKVDIAFLDIQLRGMTGLEIAKELHTLWPGTPVIFCTGYDEYARDAFRLHAAGYLSKPVHADEIREEIERIFGKEIHKKSLRIQCFGSFEVFAQDELLPVQRKKSKEVLAFLVDRKGSLESAREICATLWEDNQDEDKNLNYLYKLIADLKRALKKVNAEEVLIYQNNSYAIDMTKVDCDYYRYLEGDAEAIKAFTGEYMNQYSWAEETAACLYARM